MIHRPHLQIKKLSLNENRSFEAITINLNITTKSYLFSTIYRAPYSSKQKVTMLIFLEEFPEHVSSMLRCSKNVIILGDFNTTWNKPEHPDTTSLREIFDMYDLHQHINIQTHQLGNTLDWLISNSPDTIQDITSKDFMSDHNIEWKRPIQSQWGKLHEWLEKQPWCKQQEYTTTELQELQRCYKEGNRQTCPIKNKDQNEKKNKTHGLTGMHKGSKHKEGWPKRDGSNLNTM